MSELRGPEAALRRALLAAAEQVEPGDDGLDRIRARVTHRRPMPLPIAWVDVALTKLALRVPDSFWLVWDRVAHEARMVADHFLPAQLKSDRLRLGWLRPVAAMSAAAFLVAVVVSMAIEVPQVIAPAGPAANHSGTGTGQQPGGTGGPGQPQVKRSNSPGSPGPSAGQPSPSACPKPTPEGTITSQPTPQSSSTSQSASPTPSDTSPGTSSTPTPTPTDTSPGGSGVSPPTEGDAGAAASEMSVVAVHSTKSAGTKSRISQPACASAKPGSTSTGHPQAMGAVPWTQSAALSPAELRARNG